MRDLNLQGGCQRGETRLAYRSRPVPLSPRVEVRYVGHASDCRCGGNDCAHVREANERYLARKVAT